MPPIPSPRPAFVAATSPRGRRSNADPELLAALQAVLLAGASDLHLSVGAPPMLRIDGALCPVAGQAVWDRERVAAALHELLTDEQRRQFDEQLELDFAFTLSANAPVPRQLLPAARRIGGGVPLIPTEIKHAETLGVPEVVGQFAQLPRGLVLVTGPTGSGKSTTLAALIDLVNRPAPTTSSRSRTRSSSCTQQALARQPARGRHDTQSFANALKHVLRQDPDVILIGELRDLETISVALTAAETGHLVLATLHTQDAAQTIDRIIDVFPPHQQQQVRAQLAATLQGVVCQTLVKRANGGGRVVAPEILVVTPAVAQPHPRGQDLPDRLGDAGRQVAGMQTLDQHLADLVINGASPRAALEKATT